MVLYHICHVLTIFEDRCIEYGENQEECNGAYNTWNILTIFRRWIYYITFWSILQADYKGACYIWDINYFWKISALYIIWIHFQKECKYITNMVSTIKFSSKNKSEWYIIHSSSKKDTLIPNMMCTMVFTLKKRSEWYIIHPSYKNG